MTSPWPDAKQSCVCLAFDVDGPTGAAMLDGSIWSAPRLFSLGGYGPFRGLPRILRLLERLGIPATFYVPSWVVRTWPTACRAIVADGHEVAHHGYLHERYSDLTVAKQTEVLRISQEIFADTLGVTAVGYRTPTGDWHAQTPRLLLEHGFHYTSSLRDGDRPYRHVIDGVVTDLVEIPAHVEMDDYAYYAFQQEPPFPAGQDRIASYRTTLDNWQREFDGHHLIGGCLTTIFHPKFSATPGRIRVLESLLRYIAAGNDVWFATGSQIAARWREVAPADRTGPVA